ncbi:MAG TPA: tail fiber protein [Candidatus Acidoferrales bacterium]|nr:tail fiber protein [Candidatus Acidoferrales bacterium]
MSQPYVGEIRMFGGNFAPAGWQFCDGSLLPISEFETLFNLIGTTYGGDGQTTFAVPDLRGRLALHQGASLVIGEAAGSETVTLTTQQIPQHNHGLVGATGGPQQSPSNAYPGQAVGGTGNNIYGNTTANQPLVNTSIQFTGGNQPHENIKPFQCVSFIISLFGVFPSQT